MTKQLDIKFGSMFKPGLKRDEILLNAILVIQLHLAVLVTKIIKSGMYWRIIPTHLHQVWWKSDKTLRSKLNPKKPETKSRTYNSPAITGGWSHYIFLHTVLSILRITHAKFQTSKTCTYVKIAEKRNHHSDRRPFLPLLTTSPHYISRM